MTILAIAIFADEPVEVAVVEVGLGGITDATNVVDGQVSVVTPISLDHTDLLGDTTADIAREKAGIIKSGGFLISAAQPLDAAEVLLEKARDVQVPFRFEGVEFGVESRMVAVGGQQLTINGLAGRYEDLLLPLHGAHQAQNAAVAVAALEAFLGGGEKELNVEVLREAFLEVTSPGRLEVVRTAPTIIVDAAHNPDGMRASAAGHPGGVQLHHVGPGGRRAAGKGRRAVCSRQLREQLRRSGRRNLLHPVQFAPGHSGRASWPSSPWPPDSRRTTSTSRREARRRHRMGRGPGRSQQRPLPAACWSPGPSPWSPRPGSC